MSERERDERRVKSRANEKRTQRMKYLITGEKKEGSDLVSGPGTIAQNVVGTNLLSVQERKEKGWSASAVNDVSKQKTSTTTSLIQPTLHTSNRHASHPSLLPRQMGYTKANKMSDG